MLSREVICKLLPPTGPKFKELESGFLARQECVLVEKTGNENGWNTAQIHFFGSNSLFWGVAAHEPWCVGKYTNRALGSASVSVWGGAEEP